MYVRENNAFDSVVQTITEHKNKRQGEYLSITETLLDIDKSTGKNLDLIGKIIGQERNLINFISDPYFGFEGARNAQPYNVGYWYTLNAVRLGNLKVLDDDQYRKVLKARIIKNSTRNTRADLVEVATILADGTPIIKTLSHGVIGIEIRDSIDPDGLLSYFLSNYLKEDTLIPRQLGYRISVGYVNDDPDPEPISCVGATQTASFSSSGSHDLNSGYNIDINGTLYRVYNWVGDGSTAYLEDIFNTIIPSDLLTVQLEYTDGVPFPTGWTFINNSSSDLRVLLGPWVSLTDFTVSELNENPTVVSPIPEYFQFCLSGTGELRLDGSWSLDGTQQLNGMRTV